MNPNSELSAEAACFVPDNYGQNFDSLQYGTHQPECQQNSWFNPHWTPSQPFRPPPPSFTAHHRPQYFAPNQPSHPPSGFFRPSNPPRWPRGVNFQRHSGPPLAFPFSGEYSTHPAAGGMRGAGSHETQSSGNLIENVRGVRGNGGRRARGKARGGAVPLHLSHPRLGAATDYPLDETLAVESNLDIGSGKDIVCDALLEVRWLERLREQTQRAQAAGVGALGGPAGAAAETGGQGGRSLSKGRSNSAKRSTLPGANHGPGEGPSTERPLNRSTYRPISNTGSQTDFSAELSDLTLADRPNTLFIPRAPLTSTFDPATADIKDCFLSGQLKYPPRSWSEVLTSDPPPRANGGGPSASRSTSIGKTPPREIPRGTSGDRGAPLDATLVEKTAPHFFVEGGAQVGVGVRVSSSDQVGSSRNDLNRVQARPHGRGNVVAGQGPMGRGCARGQWAPGAEGGLAPGPAEQVLAQLTHYGRDDRATVEPNYNSYARDSVGRGKKRNQRKTGDPGLGGSAVDLDDSSSVGFVVVFDDMIQSGVGSRVASASNSTVSSLARGSSRISGAAARASGAASSEPRSKVDHSTSGTASSEPRSQVDRSASRPRSATRKLCEGNVPSGGFVQRGGAGRGRIKPGGRGERGRGRGGGVNRESGRGRGEVDRRNLTSPATQSFDILSSDFPSLGLSMSQEGAGHEGSGQEVLRRPVTSLKMLSHDFLQLEDPSSENLSHDVSSNDIQSYDIHQSHDLSSCDVPSRSLMLSCQLDTAPASDVDVADAAKFPVLGETGTSGWGAGGGGASRSVERKFLKYSDILTGPARSKSGDCRAPAALQSSSKVSSPGRHDVRGARRFDSSERVVSGRATTDQKKAARGGQKPEQKFQKPISLSLFDMISAKQQPKQVKSVPGVKGKDAVSRDINVLDSSAPRVKRGKERERPKAKKPTPLRRIIVRERQSRRSGFDGAQCCTLVDGESVVVTATSLGDLPSAVEAGGSTDPSLSVCEERVRSSSAGKLPLYWVPPTKPAPGSISRGGAGHSAARGGIGAVGFDSTGSEGVEFSPSEGAGVEFSPSDEALRAALVEKVHSRRFREYCSQTLSKEIDHCCTQLLQELVKFQDRLYERDPNKARMKRRLVMGLREVLKHLKLHKLKCVIISPNLERIHSTGGLDEALYRIISECQTQVVPLVFALSRRALGRACAKGIAVSVVGIFNYDGANTYFQELRELTEQARVRYNAMVTVVVNQLYAEEQLRLATVAMATVARERQGSGSEPDTVATGELATATELENADESGMA